MMRGSVSAVGVVALVAYAAPAFAQRAWRTPGEEDAAVARRFANEGRCNDALAPFDNAVESRSGDASLRRDRGLCHEKLGHPAPAIEDYRAYLSMQPTAPDAGAIRDRLDALEQAEPDATRSHDRGGTTGPAAGEAERDSAGSKRKTQRGLPEPGDYFVGFHLGEKEWSATGYAAPTVAYGVAAGFDYAVPLEVEARFVFLHTNVLHTGGYGFAVDNTFKVALGTAHRWELGVALGVGVERESNQLDIARSFYNVHVSPKVRILVSGPIALEAAPEAGMGPMDQASENALTGESTSSMTFYYGGYVRLSWLIRSKKAE